MKTNLKRILSLLLVLVMVFALAACGETTNKEDATKKEETTEEKPADDKATEEKTDEEKPADEKTEEKPAAKAEGPINVISREEGSGTRGAFVEIVGVIDDKKQDITVQSATVQNGTGNVVNTVKGDDKAIGYISLGSVDESVKALKVDGVEATDEKVLSGDYKIARPFLFVFKKEADLSKEAADFLKFALSKEGQEIAKEAKFITVDENAPAFEKTEGLEGTVKLSGSTSVEPLAIKLKEAYEKLNENVKIEIQANGSGQGIEEAEKGVNDIGMSSRELKEEEKLDSKPIAKDGIAVIVAPNNPVEDIAMDSVKEIYLGNITNWEDVK